MNHLERFKVAVANGEMVFVREHLNRKDVFEIFKDGRTLLHIASLNGRKDVVEFLVSRGSVISAKDVNGYTPLHLAAAQGHVEVVRSLLEAGAEVDEQDQFGNTPLHSAAWNGHSRSLELLRQHNADVNISNRVGFTALHTASQRGHNQCARSLIYGHANIEAKNKYGETPLHTSTRHGHAGVAHILISAKAKVNVTNKNKDSCLHVAASLKRNKIAKLLLEADAKKSLKNKNGDTALEVAKKYMCDDIIALLNSFSFKEKKKGLFDFLRRKPANPSSAISQSSTTSTIRDQTLSLVPSLPSSKGSGRHLEDFVSTDSFEDVRPEISIQPFHSLDRLSTNRKKKAQNRSHPIGQLPNFSQPMMEGLCDAFEPRGNYTNFWYPSGGHAGAHGSCQASGYPAGNGFGPGYDVRYSTPFQYPTNCNQHGHNFSQPTDLTNAIIQSMLYYRDLAGNLKQGPAPVNPQTSQGRDQPIDLLGPGDFHFDLDTNEFIQRNNHLYEPIGTLDRRKHLSVERDDRLRNEVADSRRNGRPVREPMLSNNNVMPLEPNVIIRNDHHDNTTERQIDLMPPTPYRLHGNQQRWDDEDNRLTRAPPRVRRQPQPMRRFLSDETISTVLSSSHARRRRTTARRYSQSRAAQRTRNERGVAVGTIHQSQEITDPRATHDRNRSTEDSSMANIGPELPRGAQNEKMNRNYNLDSSFTQTNSRIQANSMGTASNMINQSWASEQSLEGENITGNLSRYLDEDYLSSENSDQEENETNRYPDSLPSSEDEPDDDDPGTDDTLDQLDPFVIANLLASPRRNRGLDSKPEDDSEEYVTASNYSPVETRSGEGHDGCDHPRELRTLPDSLYTDGVESPLVVPNSFPRNPMPSFGMSLHRRGSVDAPTQLQESSPGVNHVTSV